MTSTLTDHFLTVKEVAELTGYHPMTVRHAVWDGKLRAFQTQKKGRVLVPISAVYEWAGQPAATDAEPTLEDTDWSEPSPDYDGNDFTIRDERTLWLPVHVSRLSEFFETKARLSR